MGAGCNFQHSKHNTPTKWFGSNRCQVPLRSAKYCPSTILKSPQSWLKAYMQGYNCHQPPVPRMHKRQLHRPSFSFSKAFLLACRHHRCCRYRCRYCCCCSSFSFLSFSSCLSSCPSSSLSFSPSSFLAASEVRGGNAKPEGCRQMSTCQLQAAPGWSNRNKRSWSTARAFHTVSPGHPSTVTLHVTDCIYHIYPYLAQSKKRCWPCSIHQLAWRFDSLSGIIGITILL